MAKIKVANPIVELDGDEMARVMWHWIRDELILPYLDVDLKYFDYELSYRDSVDNKVVAEAAAAIQKYGVGAKCAAINPDQARVEEYGLKKAWKSPNSGTRNIIGGTLFRQPIVFKNVPRLVSGWEQPITVARHAYGCQYASTDYRVPGEGKVLMTYVPKDGGEPVEMEIHDFKGPGVALGMFNTDEAIYDFVRSCFHYALDLKWSVYFGTKNTEMEFYDGRFKDIFQEVYDAEFKARFEAHGAEYEHRMVDEIAAFAIKSKGGFVWACKNFEGDIQSDMVAAGFGSLGLMTSILLKSDGKTVLTEAAHGTITRHYRQHQAGQDTSSNPIALLFAWTRAIHFRGKFDNTPEVQNFAAALEQACHDTIESGHMTGDLAALAGIKTRLNTRDFIAKIRESLDKKLA